MFTDQRFRVEVDDVRVGVACVRPQPADRHGDGLGAVEQTGVVGGAALPSRPLPAPPGPARPPQMLLGEVTERGEIMSTERLRQADGRVGKVVADRVARSRRVARAQYRLGGDPVNHAVKVTYIQTTRSYVLHLS